MALRHAILGLLDYKDISVYGIKRLFDESIKEFFAAGAGQISRELSVLQNEGLLTAQPLRGYHTTQAGRQAYRRWVAHFPDKLSREKRSEENLRLFFQTAPDKEDVVRQLRRLLGRQQKQLLEMRSYEKMVGLYAKKLTLIGCDALYWTFILRRAAMNCETTLRWAKEYLAALQNASLF